jgi:hypothetical protein
LPVAAPIDIVVAAPKAFTVVALVLISANVVSPEKIAALEILTPDMLEPVPPTYKLPPIPTPPVTVKAPVEVDVETVEDETTNVPERFAFVANVFHLKVDEPKLKPEVPGTKASVPELSFTVTKVDAPAGVEPGENEPLYPTKEMAF